MQVYTYVCFILEAKVVEQGKSVSLEFKEFTEREARAPDWNLVPHGWSYPQLTVTESAAHRYEEMPSSSVRTNVKHGVICQNKTYLKVKAWIFLVSHECSRHQLLAWRGLNGVDGDNIACTKWLGDETHDSKVVSLNHAAAG